jgi:hypothetical protein
MDPHTLDKSLVRELYMAHKALFDEVIQTRHTNTLAPLSALEHESLPWNAPRIRRDMLVPIQIRLPEHRKLQLKWIYRIYELSMNKYVVNTLEACMITDIRREISRRGLVEDTHSE